MSRSGSYDLRCIRYGTDPNLPTVATLTAATPIQRAAFELISATIPLTLT